MGFINSSSLFKLDLPPLGTFMVPAGPKVRIPLKPRDAPMDGLFYPLEASPAVFELSMSPSFVFTFVSIYVFSVLLLNQINSRRNLKPWTFSRTSTFKNMVTSHNALLALFSAWSLWGMIHGFKTHWHLATSELAVAPITQLAEFMCQWSMTEYRGMFRDIA